MSIDIYQPRVMIPAYREMKPVRTFLRDKFFAATRTYRVEKVDLDKQVKGRRVAPFVNARAPGKLVERQGFSTDSVIPPSIAMKTAITAEDVSTRQMGENVYEDRDPAARARQLLADDLLDLSEMLARREEMMCRDAIWTLSGNNSYVRARGDDEDLEFLFARLSALIIGTLTGSDAWTHADSDPIAQIDLWCELYAKLTGFVVTDLVFGGTAYRTFISNTKVKAAMINTSLIQTGVIQPNAVPNGARLVGRLWNAVNLWTYHEWYDDPDNAGTTTEMVPAKQVMLCSDQIRTERRYGGVRDLTTPSPDGVPTIVEAQALPRSWVDVETATRYLELRSRPLPVPIANHFLTAQVQA